MVSGAWYGEEHEPCQLYSNGIIVDDRSCQGGASSWRQRGVDDHGRSFRRSLELRR